MYIRRTSIKNKKANDPYFTYRLVESHRVDGKVKQRTLLNLGRYFDVSHEHWALLTSRIEQLLNEEKTLFPIELTVSLEKEAQRIFSKLHERGYGESELPQTAGKSVIICNFFRHLILRPLRLISLVTP